MGALEALVASLQEQCQRLQDEKSIAQAEMQVWPLYIS